MVIRIRITIRIRILGIILPKTLVHCLEREIPSRANRVVPVDLLMDGKLVFISQYISTEMIHKAGE